MQIINTKLIKKFITILGLLSFLIILTPIILYFYKFNNGFSEKAEDWSSFGSFIGGSIGTFFNLLAVLFSLISIYITLKITSHIQKKEYEYNLNSIERETKRNENEIQLLYKQHKPFPTIAFINLFEKTDVILSNQGLGTLVVNEWHLKLEDKKYSNFGDLIKDNLKNNYTKNIQMFCENGTKLIFNSGTEKKLFEFSTIQNSIEYNEFRKECKELLLKTDIVIKYEDIFENKYEITERIGV
ncbi:hypothetical protein [Flavobacterium limnophilum]|uniref:hypothetical protein n=1 Tax=Flavobacterium limnophilum TaxID=3003262 RepID=UPI002482753E|nr:hypothetical protein [Flavobacterium limnophilum]